MSSKAFTQQTFCWLRQINHDKRLLAIDLCVAVELTEYFNEEEQGGRAWPSCKTIGDAIGLHHVTVLRSMRRMEVAGHLRVIWGRQGKGHSSHYWMVLKPAAEQVSKPAHRQVSKPAAQSPKPVAQSPKPAATQENHLKNHPNNHHRGKRERALSPSDASLGGKGRKRPAAEVSKPDAEPGPQAELVPAIDDAFQRFWAVYPRKIGQEDARTEFTKAIKGGADSEAVIARATCYAIERATAIANGDDPKWTLYPANYLKKKSWNDPYPEGVIRDEAGNVVAIEQEEDDDDDGGDADFGTRFAEFQRMAGIKPW